jgi:hypothetical protein
MCLYPTLIRNPKYKENKKNGGVIPSVSDVRLLMLPIGCGNCMQCMKQKAREWQQRIIEDIKEYKNGRFVTLTFSNESYKELYNEINMEGYIADNKIATLAVRRFLERWRKKYKKSVRHWLVTELGHNGTENIHLHGIIWTDNVEEIEKIWKYGYVWKGKEVKGKLVNYVNASTASYITKYMTKIDTKHKYYKSIVLCSKGIGGSYAERKIKLNEIKDHYRFESGHKSSLNLYWRNKLFNEEEREKLWIEKLDKGIRYVGNKKFKNNDIKGILNEIKEQQKLNTELGYGNSKKDWIEYEYEQQARSLMQLKRISSR